MPINDDARYEKRLWLTVIKRAREEAEGERTSENSSTLQRHAREWLTSCAKKKRTRCEQTRCNEFFRVTQYAGLDKGEAKTLVKIFWERYGNATY